MTTVAATGATEPVVPPLLGPTVNPASIDKLLPPDNEFKLLLASPGARIDYLDRMYTGDIVDHECLAIVEGPIEKVYQGSGWAAARAKFLRYPAASDSQPAHIGNIGVTLFPTRERARDFFVKSQPVWRACSGRNVNFRNPEVKDAEEDVWATGQLTVAEDTMKLPRTQEGGSGWGCEMGLRVHGNAIIDVLNCALSPEGRDPGVLLDAVVYRMDD